MGKYLHYLHHLHTILIELRIKTRVVDIFSRSAGIIFTIKQTGPSMELRVNSTD
jgi:hypothetical protein